MFNLPNIGDLVLAGRIVLAGPMGKFDWVSVGGGAMLEFLATGTLAGIEALLSKVSV
ncbi:MAG: hypothetical protein UX80_C0033G0006 [Candidatus Amesbacteria bacterium GW2011_GWA2_47_11b]|uniref:phosphoglycerate kinase n=2 Tax=Candidatus Amesiibacteriota TaxID=1752730 RepID=A0A0G1TRA1_9BACT|nr:MAG: hypothetical protein UX42_C0028G0008 [Microgenomates group bacterium GW2011_GWC1_46_20]KKU56668.1 MAG: hypothetical protein UX80_C0033G0006 [Candidatus Amesbacteria bacterium GW2011_GWA2_47_11b]KKU83010.1 MAG: hypothetical protein UY11_C0032G0006 [Candidatus Amesbacteria bacterium GW2011_GWC2_47_8]